MNWLSIAETGDMRVEVIVEIGLEAVDIVADDNTWGIVVLLSCELAFVLLESDVVAAKKTHFRRVVISIRSPFILLLKCFSF